MTLNSGTRLGTYEILVPLGAGGMGEVYRARDTRLGRDVAIKALPPEFSRDPERLARFAREAKLLASLSHPNIAGIHGLEEVDGERYLVLEFVEGETLASRLEHGALPLDEALDVAKQIATGMESAHETGVIHRDLKPGNVMLTPSGGVKVLDFGLAKAGVAERAGSDLNLSASPTMSHAATQAGVILGTAAYMSPEQARGRAVDKRTDIWSFGCVLYECLTGRQAFDGETVSDLIAKILQTEPDWTRLPAAIPAHVRALLSRCLRKDAHERLRDIGEARIALAYRGETDVRAAIQSRPPGVPWWLASVGALFVAALAIVATLRFGQTARPDPVRKFDLIAKDMVVDWPIAPRLSPDGARFAYASRSQVWVRELDQLAPRAVAEIAEAGPIIWSPDSHEIVFGDSRRLWKVSAEGGRPTAICEIPGTGKIIGASWSASGKIAFSVWRDQMYQVAASGGSPTTLIDIDPLTQIDFHSPVWLPNGELLYVTHWKSDRDSAGQVRPGLAIFDGRKQIGIHGKFGGIDDTPILTPTGHLLYLLAGATPGIWAIPFDLEGRRASGTPVLVAPEAVTLSASADGSLLYVEGLYVEGAKMNVPRQLVWVDRAGKDIEPAGAPHMELARPRLSPNGRRVAFSAADGGNEDVWVLDLTTGTETRITFGPQSESSPEWLASSSRLAYIEHDGMQARVLSINADGSGAQRAFAPSTYFVPSAGSVIMTPDGKSAIRVVDQRGHGSLQVGPILSDGSLGPLKPLLAQALEPSIGDARISPDGQLLAYQTNDAGQVDIFLTRLPGGQGLWQVGTEGGFRPRWARDSGELFFVAGSGPSSRRIVSAKVSPSLDPPLGVLTHLFNLSGQDDLSDFDVAADGRRLLFTRPSGGVDPSAQHLVLVQNWQAELEKKGGR